MHRNEKCRKRQRLWRGLTSVTASLLIFALTAMPIVERFRTDIDKFLGTSSTRMILEDGASEKDLYSFSTDYSNTTELVQAIADLGERMSEEGTVLLKNNGALPLSQEETGKISLMGYSGYYPTMGGDMGSTLTPNTGTDADTVDFVQALQTKGFTINPVLQEMYGNEKLYDDWNGEGDPLSKIQAPFITGVFSSKEPSGERMDQINPEWRESMNDYNVMLVVLSRSAAENRTYYPGEEGVDPEQDLNQADPLGLSDTERQLIQSATEAADESDGKVIVLLNNANPMEIEEISENSGVDAILQIGFPGGYGFYGIADILSGAANPSGHLSDTYAVDNSSAPSAQNYGNYEYVNADTDNCINSALVEAENIYIGYKYYETRYMDSVLGQGNAASSAGSSDGGNWTYENEVSYPFGYGLSYTSFEQTFDQMSVDLEKHIVTADITVTNTGNMAGKDAVQLYVSAPYTDYDRDHGVEKAGIQLLDYAKTPVIEPGESVTLTIEADMQYMASWDSTASNAAGTSGCYILDAGTYYFTLGNGAHEAVNNVLGAMGRSTADGMTEDGNPSLVRSWESEVFDNTTFAYTKNGTAVENQLEDLDLNYWMPDTVTYLTRNDWEGTWPETYKELTATDEMLDYMDNDIYEISSNGNPDNVVFDADNDLTLASMKGNKDLDDPKWDELMDQLSLEEALIRTAFGGVSTKAMKSINSPEAVQNDGPNGIYSYPLGQYANYDVSSGDPCAVTEDDPNLEYKAGVMGNETVIAQTFSKELSQEYGRVMGNYSLWANLPIWWGCGTNLHRSPYNARNHEYYSEDAVLTSFQGAAMVSAGLEYGLLIAPKHIAFNDTEINRIGISTFMTEQQARENELRGTQSVIEDAHALAAMSAFNRVGVLSANSHTGLLINILRKEWGFQGLLSEDAIPYENYQMLKEAVLNGVTMTTKTGEDNITAVAENYPFWTVENVSRDETMLTALKQGMKWQAYALANSNVMEGMSDQSRLVTVRTWYDNVLTGLQIVFAGLAVICIFQYIRSAKKAEQNGEGGEK